MFFRLFISFCFLFSFLSADSTTESYPWKGLIQDEATSDVVTLSRLTLNGHSRVAVVKPGEQIQGEVKCAFDSKKCSKFALYHIVIGIHGEGPMTSIYNGMCLFARDSFKKFALTAPERQGVYQVRFKTVRSLFKKTAFKSWSEEEPGTGSTIGILVVKA